MSSITKEIAEHLRSKGYQACEYIESQGGQYINTGFYHNQDTRFVLECEIVTAISGGEIVGSYGGTGTDKFMFLGIPVTKSNFYAYYGTKKIEFTAPTGILDVDFNKNVLTINDYTYTFDYHSAFTSDYPSILFGVTIYDGSVVCKGRARIYTSEIFDNGTLVRNYYPCYNISTGEIGLYDMVSDSFFGNNGTGTFLKGADIVFHGNITREQIEYLHSKGYQACDYIESTGTQYIDSGIIPNDHSNGLNIHLQFAVTNLVAQYFYGGGGYGSPYRNWTTFENAVSSSGSRAYWNCGDKVIEGYWVLNINKIYTFDARYSNGQCSINGNYTTSFTYGGPLSLTSLYFLAVHAGNGSVESFAYCKLYKLEIMGEGTPLRDYYPCYNISTGEIGLYDMVSDSFFGNNGTGVFLKGNDIVLYDGSESAEILMKRVGCMHITKKATLLAEFTSPGAFNYTIPDGVEHIGVFVVGGGGSGHGDFTNAGHSGNGGNGGCVNTFLCDGPFVNRNISGKVGSGGFSNSRTSANGEDSYFILESNKYISAGGYGGNNSLNQPNQIQVNSGLGGQYSFSNPGNYGGNGLKNTLDPSDDFLYGAGGGGGSCAYQMTFNTPAYGGQTGGGNGGYGSNNSSLNSGTPGTFYGAGGGGASFGSDHVGKGGAGYNGIIKIYKI